jgi:hypothetical protein
MRGGHLKILYNNYFVLWFRIIVMNLNDSIFYTRACCYMVTRVKELLFTTSQENIVLLNKKTALKQNHIC